MEISELLRMDTSNSCKNFATEGTFGVSALRTKNTKMNRMVELSGKVLKRHKIFPWDMCKHACNKRLY